jgi:hypothetical protein
MSPQEDYKQAVKEIDAKLFGNLQLICAELRNNYVRVIHVAVATLLPFCSACPTCCYRFFLASLFLPLRLSSSPSFARQSLLYDHITKNLEKIKHPRGSRGSAMVY